MPVWTAAVVPGPTAPTYDPRTHATLRSWCKTLSHYGATRFSVAKTKKFFAYTYTSSLLREIAVVLAFPVPGLLTAIALSLVPLQRPMDGMAANWGIFIHQGLLHWLAMVGGLLQARAASMIDHEAYSTLMIATIATVAAVHCVGIFALVSYVWRFPVPFYVVIAPWAFVVSLVWVHFLVACVGRLPSTVRTKLLQYVSPLALQVSQLALYPSYSALFQAANESAQILLVLLFPCIKFLLRRWILVVSHHLNDFAKEIAVCGVEISASLYQATIMQTSPSALVTASIIGIDVIVCVVEIKMYLDHKSLVPTHEILGRAAFLLETIPMAQNHDLHRSKTAKGSRKISLSAIATRFGNDTAAAGVPSSAVGGSPRPSLANSDKLILAQARQILQAAESILLVEYLEVSVPLMNACLLAVTSQLPSARYNRVLEPFYEDPRELGPAIASIMLYSMLQAVTLVGLCVVLRVRYRLSAMKLLAFVLEEHKWSLQGKLIMWLAGTLSIPIIHYGVDFTFQFDFTV